jgi:hypothetical protein
MKIGLVFFFFILFVNNATKSQTIGTGSVVPNFVLTDTKGNVHDLHATLDSGYSVVLLFWAKNCNGCWIRQHSGVIDDFYKNYGPQGTNEVRIWSLEILETDSFWLSNWSGLGALERNWFIKEKEYSTFLSYYCPDVLDLKNAYNILSTPASFRICAQDKKSYPMSHFPYSGMIDGLNACPVLHSTDLSVDRVHANPYVCSLSDSLQAKVYVQNSGSISFYGDLEIEVWDNTNFLISQTFVNVSLTSNQLDSFTVNGVMLLSDASELTFKINYSDDKLENNQIKKIFYVAPEVSTNTQLLFCPSISSPEMQWTFKNETAGGNEYYQVPAGTFTSLNNFSLFDTILNLDTNTCYALDVLSDYGFFYRHVNNSLVPFVDKYSNSPVARVGGFRLVDNYSSQIYLDTSYFYERVSFKFKTYHDNNISTSEKEIKREKNKGPLLYPNPTNGKVSFSSLNHSIERLIIYNIFGQKILEINTPNKNSFDLNGQAYGTYIILGLSNSNETIFREKLIYQNYAEFGE